MNVAVWAGRIFQALALVACLITAISAIHSNLWWIRILDFPRTAMLVTAIVLAVCCAAFARRGRWLAVSALLVAAGWHAWRIRTYTPLVGTELALDTAKNDDVACFTAIGLNVFQHNRDYSRTIAMLQRERPGVVLLMETDSLWLAALAPVLATYPHVMTEPLDNTYGMIFASQLTVREAHFERPTTANTPTLYATLVLRSGKSVAYVGLHPRPPLPGQDTEKRDANIARAAHRQANDPMPALAMGDFNDVAWSRTTQRFKAAGGYLDPRVGRGLYATFPASHILFGWPLDQIFVTPAFTVRYVRVLENVGSDHRPLAVRLCSRD